MYEIQAVMNYEYYAHKDSWEQTRLLAYIMAQVNSRKTLKQSDILDFYWEKKEVVDTGNSNSDLERLKKKAQQYIKQTYG